MSDLSPDPQRAARRVLVVPGLAVRGYAAQAVDALCRHGYDAELLDPPTWRGVPCDLRSYGAELARRIDDRDEPVSVLVGLSVGTQVAAAAATGTGLVDRLLLVSPTVDPALRSRARLMTAFLVTGEEGGPSLWHDQVPDWKRAGVRRILRGFASAVEVRLEEMLPDVRAELTLIHAEQDQLSSHHFAAGLAAAYDGRLLVLPGGNHSWPTGDQGRFVELMDELVA